MPPLDGGWGKGICPFFSLFLGSGSLYTVTRVYLFASAFLFISIYPCVLLGTLARGSAEQVVCQPVM